MYLCGRNSHGYILLVLIIYIHHLHLNLNQTKRMFFVSRLSLVIFLAFVSTFSFAQMAGGEISYKCLSKDNYKVSVTIYAKCPVNSLPSRIDISYYSPSENANKLGTNLFPEGSTDTILACVGQISKCNGGLGETSDALIKRTYSGTISLPRQKADWVVETQTVVRTTLNTLSTNQDFMYLAASINNTVAVCNSSPSFSSVPPIFATANQKIDYTPNLLDPDKDNLSFTLIKPRIANSSVAYIAPYSEKQPIKTKDKFTLDPITGKMSYTPSNQGDMSVTTVLIQEKRGATVVGSTMREMYFQTLAEQTNRPVFVGADTLRYCVNDSIDVNYFGVSSSGLPLTIIWNNKAAWNAELNGDTFAVVQNNGSASFKMNIKAKTAITKILDLTILDNNCGSTRKNIVVKVYPKPILYFNIQTDLLLNCFDPKKPLVLEANIINGTGYGPFQYRWAKLPDTKNSIVVATSDTFTVFVKDGNNCLDTAKRIIVNPIDFVKSNYCTDQTTEFYDRSRVAGPKADMFTGSQPLATTKSWKWTIIDGTKTVVLNTEIAQYKFTKKGWYKIKLETSDGTPACTSAVSKDIFICGRPPATFKVIDSCTTTPLSSLKLFDFAKDTSLCPIKDTSKVRFYVDGKFRTSVVNNRYPTNINISSAGRYKITLVVQNEAGCIDSSSQMVTVRESPTVSKNQDSYYYRCDQNFPDTSFTFRAVTKLTDSLAISKIQSRIISRTGYSDSSFIQNTLEEAKVPFKIVQNQNATVTFTVADAYGCANKAELTISDPINPAIYLRKYYCHESDNLFLVDTTFSLNNYAWGLKTAVWDMKDGKTETTLGFADHVYSANALDSAWVKLNVTDNTGCTDSDSIKVYLGEPDVSQFQIKEPFACFADTVRIFGIKDKMINSWFYRYRTNPEAVLDTAEKRIYNKRFGRSYPSNLDTIQFFKSKKYIATTEIYYNEPDTAKNFEKIYDARVGKRVNIRPLIPTNVCHVRERRDWKIVERLHYGILDDYNHCFDSSKTFTAKFLDPVISGAVLDTTSFIWSLYAPDKQLLAVDTLKKSSEIQYTPNKNLFTEIATTRQSYNTFAPKDPNTRVGQYLPYRLKVKYGYQSEGLTCNDTASLWLGNELVKVEIDTSPSVTCLNYTRSYYFKSPRFIELVNNVDERDASIWNFGDDSTTIGALPRRRYQRPGNYTVRADVKNYYGCPATDTFLLRIKPSPTAKLAIDSVCFGNESVLNASASIPSEPSSKITNYYWYFANNISKNPFPAIPGDTTEPFIADASQLSDTAVISHLFKTSQNVGLVVRDENGCYDETELVLAEVNPLPVVSFDAKTVLTNDEDFLGNEAIHFDATTQHVTQWTWSMGNGDKVVSPANVSDYDINYTYPYFAPPNPVEKNIYDVTLKVRTEGGCVDSASKKIDVNVYFIIPTAFSPNGDGLHDNVIGVGKGIKELKEFSIYNRWGEIIHSFAGIPEKDESHRGYFLWDGYYKGKLQPIGSYVYYAVVVTGYGEQLIFKGNLALLK